MNERIRLRNPQKFNVGIVTPDKPHGLNIAPGAFTIVSQDDLDYLMGTSRLLQKGVLRVDGAKNEEVMESLGIENANQLKKWLDSTEAEPYVLNRIAEVASGMNLSMNKIQILKDKIPKFEFIK